MTISTSANKFRYEGNGVTDTFAFNGRIFEDSDLVVEIITRSDDTLEQTLTLTTDYTVTINTNESASVQVSALKIPSNTQDIQIRRSIPRTQSLDLPTGTVFPAVSVENALDKNVAILQDQSEEIGRSVKLPITSSVSEIELPNVAASTLIGWNSAGNDLTTYDFNVFPSDFDVVVAELGDNDYLRYDYDNEYWVNVEEDQLKVDLGVSNKIIATVDPTVNEDANDSYAEFDLWLNSVSNDVFLLRDNTVGAADWAKIVFSNATFLEASNNLSDLDNAGTARTNLDVYSKSETDIEIDNKAIGIDQSWVNVLGSRSLGVTYTNTTGKPIYVTISQRGNSGTFVVDSITLNPSASNASTIPTWFSAIIPNNSTYSLTGGNTPVSWAELR